ncbi:hypothetical protein ACJ72_08501 [Emergomyces africanus]|uniref:Uncharacterized protein n=1 Tax=Emergomyces africanus TaxID=1955775 RepID=A0A1B7NK66_9EURO|nr:hypothetical protein ACJ72_08501 [Emergomyces africanus]
MSGRAFQPIQRPSSTDTLIDPRGDHIRAEEYLAVLALFEFSGCSLQQMKAAEIQLSWTIHTPENAPPESDSFATGKKQSVRNSSSRDTVFLPETRVPPLRPLLKKLALAWMHRPTTQKWEDFRVKQPSPPRKDSRRMIEAMESGNLKAYH